MWKRVIAFAHRFGFTQNESAVVVFLSAVIITGSVLNELHSTGSTPPRDIREVYADADSAFAHRAAQSGAADSVAPVAASAKDAAAGPTQALPSVALNTATAQQLTALPGVGPATAAKIIAYREEHGPFRSPADLMNVKGIGRKKYEDIRQFITVE